MVTTRQRKAVSGPRFLDSRLDAGETTDGPLTLDRTDPKVSVSSARVDRQGIHVSLTIPLDSSIVQQPTGRAEAVKLNEESSRSYQRPRTRSRSRHATSHHSPEPSTVTAAAEDAAALRASNQSPKPKRSSQRAQLSPKRGASRRSRGALSTSPESTTRAARLPNHSANGPLQAPNSNLREESSLPQVRRTVVSSSQRAASPAQRRRKGSNSARTRQGASSLQPIITPQIEPSQTALSSQLAPPETVSLTYEQRFLNCSSGKCEDAGLRQSSQPCEAVAAPPNRLPVAAHYRYSRTSNNDELKLIERPVSYWRISKTQRAIAAAGRLVRRQWGGPATGLLTPLLRIISRCRLPIALFFLAFLWTRYCGLPSSFPATLRWTLYGRYNPPYLSAGLSENGERGRFYVTQGPVIQECLRLGHICKADSDQLCGFAVDVEIDDCASLGRDVAAREAGGSIDYSATSGKVTQKALEWSRMLQQVASFSMPSFPSFAPPAWPANYGASEPENVTLRHGYFPLYNHDNDPGMLLADPPATYIINEDHGQVAVSLSHRAPVFAVAMETPAEGTSDGQCGPLEARWLSVYVYLDEHEKSACPLPSIAHESMKMAGRTGTAGQWCEAGAFEYRCIGTSALQVFCLRNPRALSSPIGPSIQSRESICGTSDGWLTDRLLFVLKRNWGAEATRVRRLRVLAHSASSGSFS